MSLGSVIKEEENELIIFEESSEKLIFNSKKGNWEKLTSEKIDNEDFNVYTSNEINSQIKIFIDPTIEVEF